MKPTMISSFWCDGVLYGKFMAFDGSIFVVQL
jgi:hypothetical protein